MKTTTVRISQKSHSKLHEIAERENHPLQQILDKAIEHYYEKLFWEQTHQAYARLKDNPEEWKDEQDERQIWENTLKDGLSDG